MKNHRKDENDHKPFNLYLDIDIDTIFGKRFILMELLTFQTTRAFNEFIILIIFPLHFFLF